MTLHVYTVVDRQYFQHAWVVAGKSSQVHMHSTASTYSAPPNPSCVYGLTNLWLGYNSVRNCVLLIRTHRHTSIHTHDTPEDNWLFHTTNS